MIKNFKFEYNRNFFVVPEEGSTETFELNELTDLVNLNLDSIKELNIRYLTTIYPINRSIVLHLRKDQLNAEKQKGKLIDFVKFYEDVTVETLLGLNMLISGLVTEKLFSGVTSVMPEYSFVMSLLPEEFIGKESFKQIYGAELQEGWVIEVVDTPK